MSNDPAFLFYSSDFLSGIADLTMEERGQYITLLCFQHQKGELSEKTIRLTVGSVSVDVIAKFSVTKTGCYINNRLADEIEKRKIFTESRRNNGKLGGRKAIGKPNEEPIAKPIGKPKKNLMEDVNENEDVIKIINELSKNEIQNSIEFVKITGQKMFTDKDVKCFWEAFLTLNEKTFYNTRDDKLKHFRNWLKKQDNGNSKTYQSGNNKGVGSVSEDMLAALRDY